MALPFMVGFFFGIGNLLAFLFFGHPLFTAAENKFHNLLSDLL